MTAGDTVICISNKLGVVKELGEINDDSIDKPKIGEELIVFDTIIHAGRLWLRFKKYDTEESNNCFLSTCFELLGQAKSDT